MLCQANILQDRKIWIIQKKKITFSNWLNLKLFEFWSSRLQQLFSVQTMLLINHPVTLSTHWENETKPIHKAPRILIWKKLRILFVFSIEMYHKFNCDPPPTQTRQLKVWRIKSKQTFTQADKVNQYSHCIKAKLTAWCLLPSSKSWCTAHPNYIPLSPLMKHQRIKHPKQSKTEKQPWNSSDTSAEVKYQ